MITGYYKNIENSDELLEKAFHWLEEEQWKSLPDGRYDIVGNDVYANISSYSTKEPEIAKFEKHIVYTDVQMMVEGNERCYVTQNEKIFGNAEGKYNASNDITFFDGTSNGAHEVIMTPGLVAVLFPEDAHMPAVAYDVSTPVRKVVIKVKCS